MTYSEPTGELDVWGVDHRLQAHDVATMPEQTSTATSRAASRKDKTTLSNYEEVHSSNVSFKLEVDFKKKRLEGWVEHTMVVDRAGTSRAVFDTSELNIMRVEVDGLQVSHRLLPSHEVYGTPLEVSIRPGGGGLDSGMKVKVKIHYSTSPATSACQWLSPEQTKGKRHPYLFTQSQAIHARSMFPCQDAPALKVTYDARITAPNWATALMSALREPEQESMDGAGRKTFVWKQPVPVPTYLIALAVGELESREIDPRVRVWSEPSMVEECAYEFGQTPEFLRIAEDLTIPYVWGRYDLLCLPPSFPYGGMENTCLTFVTPTLLAGDRSLADVVAHEISHSWSGNLITNATWEHFWLNEGWTMWLQRKIMTRMHGDPKFADLDSYYLGWKHLEADIEAFADAPELTALVPDLTDIDPDDSFSGVPYEKGFCLLLMLERIVGSEAFEAFAKTYFTEFKYKTVTSEEFRQFLLKHFNDDTRLVELPWDDLFYRPGLPPKPEFDLSLAEDVERLADDWYEGSEPETGMDEKFAAWTTLQKQIFLERLLDRFIKTGPMPVSSLEKLDQQCQLGTTKNSEIRYRWNQVCLRAGAKFILPNTVDFVTSQGRMKFTRPLYRELHKSAIGKGLAVETFKKHAHVYHPIARKMIMSDLSLNKQQDLEEEWLPTQNDPRWSLLLAGGLIAAVAAAVAVGMMRRRQAS